MILKDVKKLVVINAGHHNNDSGHVTSNGVKENEEVKKIRDELLPLLRKNFQIVPIPDNLDIKQSCQLANLYLKTTKDGIALDIHTNARAGETQGTECYSTGEKIERIISKTLTKHIAIKLGTFNRGWKDQRDSWVKSLMFVNKINSYSPVLEVCYLDNKQDRERLLNGGHKKVAEGINEALLELWGINKSESQEIAEIGVKLSYIAKVVALLEKLIKGAKFGNFVAKIRGKSRNS